MKKTIVSMFETGMLQVLCLLVLLVCAFAFAGCQSPKKMRDIELKGMYVNGYSEVLAIGSGRLTSIPGEREALAAHYSEDTAWLQPNIKTHALDLFLVGTNSVESSKEIIKSICEAFKEVAPTVVKENAEVSKSVATATPLGVVQSAGEVRKATELAKEVKSQLGSDKVEAGSDSVKAGSDKVEQAQAGSDSAAASQTSQQSQTSQSDCPDGSCTTGACTDGSCNLEVK